MVKQESRINFLSSDYHSVIFNNEINPRIQVYPMYFERGFSSCPYMYGRRVVRDRLLKALENLPSQYGFIIWDVYRPREVQAKLFEWMREKISKQHPHLSDEENVAEAKKYAAPPSKVGDVYCPPHLSGGAIDLTLYEIASGKEVEMGAPFDDCTPRAHRDYFDFQVELPDEEEEMRKKRHLLRSAMEKVGFVSYQYEWWHFDIGNIYWSYATGEPTVFGPLFGNEEWPS